MIQPAKLLNRFRGQGQLVATNPAPLILEKPDHFLLKQIGIVQVANTKGLRQIGIILLLTVLIDDPPRRTGNGLFIHFFLIMNSVVQSSFDKKDFGYHDFGVL